MPEEPQYYFRPKTDRPLRVLVLKPYHAPLRAGLTTEGLQIDMEFDDFLAALCQELGAPLLLRGKTLPARVREAARRVLEQMKAKSTEVV
jgi:hypothetical protein